MRISVIGCGYLGAVHAAAMAELGCEVVGIDTDAAKIASLAAGTPFFHEPGLPELLARHLASGRLAFTTDPAAAAGADIHYLCVGTPQRADGQAADLTAVWAAVGALAPLLAEAPAVVVGKSTVPVGTARAVAARLAEANPDAALLWNPEFLREGTAVADSLTPSRIVWGTGGGPRDAWALDVADRAYAPILGAGVPRLVMGYESAELVKQAANSFLAVKVSFINSIAAVCEAAGADVTEVAAGIGADDRIGAKFLKAGPGYGGGCLPKDVRGLLARGAELGVGESLELIAAAEAVNARARARVVDKVRAACEGTLAGRRIGVLGAAFKAETSDLRGSPAIDIIAALADAGAHVAVYDPAARLDSAEAPPGLAARVTMAADAAEAAAGADCVVICTEWPEFAALTPAALEPQAAARNLVDARNCLDPAPWRAAGWRYWGVGR